jgi:hypothetical protein
LTLSILLSAAVVLVVAVVVVAVVRVATEPQQVSQ